jgi:putative hydrolase
MTAIRSTVIDVHTHTFYSDGSLSPMELVRRAVVNGYEAIAITDHVGIGGVDELLSRLRLDRAVIERYWPITVIVGVELTHVPPEAIGEVAAFARDHGAEIVVVHGETPVEPVPAGTNYAAIACGLVDVLGHPGLLTSEEAALAARNGVFLELTARRGHSLTNGHVQQTAQAAGAQLIVNSDSHDPSDLLTPAFQERVARGSGLAAEHLQRVLLENADSVLNRVVARRTS